MKLVPHDITRVANATNHLRIDLVTVLKSLPDDILASDSPTMGGIVAHAKCVQTLVTGLKMLAAIGALESMGAIMKNAIDEYNGDAEILDVAIHLNELLVTRAKVAGRQSDPYAAAYGHSISAEMATCVEQCQALDAYDETLQVHISENYDDPSMYARVRNGDKDAENAVVESQYDDLSPSEQTRYAQNAPQATLDLLGIKRPETATKVRGDIFDLLAQALGGKPGDGFIFADAPPVSGKPDGDGGTKAAGSFEDLRRVPRFASGGQFNPPGSQPRQD